MNFGSLFLFFVLVIATSSLSNSSELPKIKRGCTANYDRTKLTNTLCTPFVYRGTEYKDGCAQYGSYLWCVVGERTAWSYCGPCLDDVITAEPVAKEASDDAAKQSEFDAELDYRN